MLQKLKINGVVKIFLLLAIASLTYPYGVNAQSSSLRITPSLIKIQARTASNITTPLKIENNSNESVRLNLQLRLFRGSDKENGEIEFLSDKTNSSPIFEKVQILEEDTPTRQVTIGPKQSKSLQLKINLSENEPAADYYFTILFIDQTDYTRDLASAQGFSASLNNQAGIGTNVLLSIGPKKQPDATILDFEAESKQKGPVSMSLRVRNNNSQFFIPKGLILIKNMFGQTVGRIDLPAANILSNSTREIKVSWDEKVLFGLYTADLSLALSEDGPVVYKTTKFSIIPTQLIAGLLIFIVFALIVYTRAKTKLRTV